MKNEKYVILGIGLDDKEYIWSFHEDQFGNLWYEFKPFNSEKDSFNSALMFDNKKDVETLLYNIFPQKMKEIKIKKIKI